MDKLIGVVPIDYGKPSVRSNFLWTVDTNLQTVVRDDGMILVNVGQQTVQAGHVNLVDAHRLVQEVVDQVDAGVKLGGLVFSQKPAVIMHKIDGLGHEIPSEF